LFLLNYILFLVKILHCDSLIIGISIIPVIERMIRVHFVRETVVINSARFSGICTRKVRWCYGKPN